MVSGAEEISSGRSQRVKRELEMRQDDNSKSIR